MPTMMTESCRRVGIGGLGRTMVELVSTAPPPANTLSMPFPAPLGGLGGVSPVCRDRGNEVVCQKQLRERMTF